MQETPFDLRFRLGRIPVVIEPTFWLMALVMGMRERTLPRILVWIGVVFVSVLVHEMGHALAAQVFGSRSSVRLYSFGGLTYPERRLSRWRRVALSLAGPGAGFALAGLTLLALSFHPTLTELGQAAVGDLLFANIGWGVMNLLPVPPLDGGHVLLDTLGPRRERIGRYIGIGAGALVALWGLTNGQPYLALLFGYLVWTNVQALGVGRR